jgi:hypothetical protein
MIAIIVLSPVTKELAHHCHEAYAGSNAAEVGYRRLLSTPA